LFSATVFAAPPPATPAQPAAAKTAAPMATKTQLQEVTYEELAKHLNQRIVVRTTLHTERSGTLVKYSGTSIQLKLDSGAVLTMPHDTLRTIGVPVAPPDPLFPQTK
jgi:hypothetical protein